MCKNANFKNSCTWLSVFHVITRTFESIALDIDFSVIRIKGIFNEQIYILKKLSV